MLPHPHHDPDFQPSSSSTIAITITITTIIKKLERISDPAVAQRVERKEAVVGRNGGGPGRTGREEELTDLRAVWP
eukprot:3507688-Rhodomonas_salina.1